MNRSQKGFTLIELMIVVAIIAILVSLAVPAYRDYTIRAKVTECIALSSVAKTSISEYQQTTSVWPPSQAAAGIPTSLENASDFCSIYDYNDGNGDFYLAVDSASIGIPEGSVVIPVFSPTMAAGGNINWLCTVGFTTADALKYLPSSCRGENIF